MHIYIQQLSNKAKMHGFAPQHEIESIIQSSFQISKQLHSQYFPLITSLRKLKDQSKDIVKCFEDFKEMILCMVNQAMGKITSSLYKEIQIQHKLQEELYIVQESNAKVKDEVVQLRKMMQQFISEREGGAACENVLESMQMQGEEEVQSCTLRTEKQENNGLQVIQQVSEYTGSVISSNFISQRQPPIPAQSLNFQPSNQDIPTIPDQSTGSNKKIKNFLDFFRQKVDESIHQEFSSEESPLTSIDNMMAQQNYEINLPKNMNMKALHFIKDKKTYTDEFKGFKKENVSCEGPMRGSHFFSTHRRIKSEHQSYRSKMIGSSEKDSRSNSKTHSKQKIKLSAKIIEENEQFMKKNRKALKIRPLVHLGGRNHIKKLIKDIKSGLQNLKIWEANREREVTYDGQRKNGSRWGKGSLLFDNGFVYEGDFVQNYRHGYAKVLTNGICLYQGQWCLDELNGQGYIKSLKNFSLLCPKVLHESSYNGQFMQNRFNGMGTLFLNQNEKIVTKFVHGVPVGEYTYYNNSEIEFGTWF